MDLDKTPRTELKPNEEGFRYVLMWMNHILSDKEYNLATPDYIIEWRDFILDCQRELNRLRNPAPVEDEDAPVTNVSLALDETCSMIAWLKETLNHDESDATIISMRRIEKALRDQILKESAAGKETKVNTSGTVHQPNGETTSGTASSADQSQGGKP